IPGARKQLFGETGLRVFLEQRRGQPQRLVTPNEPGDPTRVSLPPRVIGSRAGPMVEVQNRLKQVCEGIVKEPDQGIAIWIRKSDFRPMLLPHKEHDDTAKVTVGKLAATIVPNAERWREHTSPARSKTALVNAGAKAAGATAVSKSRLADCLSARRRRFELQTFV